MKQQVVVVSTIRLIYVNWFLYPAAGWCTHIDWSGRRVHKFGAPVDGCAWNLAATSHNNLARWSICVYGFWFRYGSGKVGCGFASGLENFSTKIL